MPVRPSLRLSPKDAELALLGLLAVDMEQMRRAGPNRPRVRDLIRERRIRYTRHDPNEHWQTYDEVIGQVRRLGFALADCEDQATMLAAELRVDGLDPEATPRIYRTGPRMSHVVTDSHRFGRLDPSRWSGMGWDEPSPEAARGYRELLGLPGSRVDLDRQATSLQGRSVIDQLAADLIGCGACSGCRRCQR